MKVLIVDDDAIQRMLLADLLQRFEQVEIVEAVDGDTAWAELEAGLCPVLCCCDVRMPGISGIELLRRTKGRPALAGVPFIFITAATDRETIEQAIASGASNYILKPFDITKARYSLEKAFRGIRERYSESPLVTQRRLRIAADKLLAYYDALKQQLGSTLEPIADRLTEGDTAGARARLDGLRTGCSTLGLWHAAATIEHVQPLERDLVARTLAEAAAMVDEQTVRARGDFGIAAPPAPKAAADPEEAAQLAEAD